MPATTKSYDELRLGFLFREFWGFDKAPTPSNFEVYAKALLVMANADGELKDEERDFVLGLIAGMGGQPSLIEELRNYPATDDIQTLLSRDPDVHASARALVFDAIRACSADGLLHPRELAKINEVAHELSIPTEDVEKLQDIYTKIRRNVGELFRVAYPDPKNRPF
ncbi:tellurium resistance protein [Streptomyces sp. CA-132043]|uniref:tellurium resistance protein n=1 Tax=Streptomyces sp. CA-132043 TaxID=3240048 RepID=UPI003D90ECAA